MSNNPHVMENIAVLILKHKRWVLGFPVMMFLMALFYQFALKDDEFKTSAQILVTPHQYKVKSNISGMPVDDMQNRSMTYSVLLPMDYLKLATTPSVLQSVIDKMDLKNKETKQKWDYQQILPLIRVYNLKSKGGLALREGLNDESSSGVLTIETKGHDAYQTALMANSLAEVLIDKGKNIRMQELQGIYSEIEKKYVSTKNKLAEAEEGLTRFQTEAHLDLKQNELASKKNELAVVNQKYLKVKMEFEERKSRMEALEEEIKSHPKVLMVSKSISDDALFETIRQKGTGGLSSSMNVKFDTESINPVYQSLKSQLAVNRVDHQVLTHLGSKYGQMSEKYAREVSALDDLVSSYTLKKNRLTQQLSVTQSIYQSLAKDLEEVKIIANDASDVRIIAEALPPRFPEKKSMAWPWLALFLSFGFSLVFLFFKESYLTGLLKEKNEPHSLVIKESISDKAAVEQEYELKI